MKKAVNFLVSILFIFLTPAVVFLGTENLDAPLFAAALFAGALAVSALFFAFSGYEKKGKLVIAGITCLVFASMLLSNGGRFHNRGFAAALNSRFADIATWSTRTVDSSHAPVAIGGTFIFYNADAGRFDLERYVAPKYAEKVEDIAVVAFYSKSAKKAGTYYEERSGEKYADAIREEITIHLLNAKTKACFARKTFSARMTNPTIQKGGNTSNAIHVSSGEILWYIENSFQ